MQRIGYFGFNMGRLIKKIALITGASRGLGAATAKLFIDEGAEVILTDILDNSGRALAGELGAQYYHLDASLEADWQYITKLILKQYGRLDVLFTKAGMFG